ncbi:MAG: glycosyltransferase family 4 protein [Acidobacteria bacterium]|nr:glycosyltransferase family 4 protein [Acidobacteriota bacterium]
MKILFVTSRFPYPPMKGDQVVLCHRLQDLSRKHDITLLSLYEKNSQLADLQHLRPWCRAIHLVKLPKWRSYVNVAFKGPFSRSPLQILYYRCRAFQDKIDHLLATDRFDLIHAFLLRVAPYIRPAPIPKVIDLNDSMSLNLKRRLKMEGPFKRFLLREELRRITVIENGLSSSLEQVIVVSESDRASIPGANVDVVPIGVNADYFAPCGQLGSREPMIIFSGNMSYAPNIHAVRWFAANCFPLIRDGQSAARFVIAGNNPPLEVRRLEKQDGIQVLGFVDSMPAVLNRARLGVAPMQSGSGMQIKILEAMSCGLPVVTTTIGLGSIKCRPGLEVFVADTAENFAKRTLALLRDSAASRVMGAAGRRFVLENHSWESASRQVDDIYRLSGAKLRYRSLPQQAN